MYLFVPRDYLYFSFVCILLDSNEMDRLPNEESIVIHPENGRTKAESFQVKRRKVRFYFLIPNPI